MKILAVDDEMLQLEKLEDVLYHMIPEATIVTSRRASDVLRLIQDNSFDIAFLDVQMPGISGVELAEKIKEVLPRINIIFCTAYDEFKSDAMDLRASGYILKPVTVEKVARELVDLRYPVDGLNYNTVGKEEAKKSSDSEPASVPQKALQVQPVTFQNTSTAASNFSSQAKQKPLLYIQCFGNFDVFDSEHRPVRFERSKSKEMLAYLVLRNGARCSNHEVVLNILGSNVYDYKVQDSFRHVTSAMMKALKSVHAESAIIKERQNYSIDVQKVDCDYFKFLQADYSVLKTYTGDFMRQYSWSEDVHAYLEKTINGLN